MQLSFEQEKNIKAAVYTGLICLGLSLIFFVFKFQEPAPTVVPPLPEYMEVNLGNSNTGAGEIPPMSKAAPAPEPTINASAAPSNAGLPVITFWVICVAASSIPSPTRPAGTPYFLMAFLYTLAMPSLNIVLAFSAPSFFKISL